MDTNQYESRSDRDADSRRCPHVWQLTPSNSRPLAGLQWLSWLLPTAGTLNPETGQLTVTSWPDTEMGRSWHGALETSRELACEDIDSLRRLPIGDTTIVWLRTGEWPPVVAALPSSVGDRLTVDCC